MKMIDKVPKVIADSRILVKFRKIRNARLQTTIEKQCRLSKDTVYGLKNVSWSLLTCQLMALSEQKQRLQRQLESYNDTYAAPRLRKELALAIVSNP